MSKQRSKIPSYLCEYENTDLFARVTPDLLRSAGFQSLTHAARAFYIVLVTHKNTRMQSECLYRTLETYYRALGIEKTNEELQDLAGQNPRCVFESRLFVCPVAHLKEYGYSASYASKLKKELETKGFIRVFANGKAHGAGNLQGANRDFSKDVTIYEFIPKWKREKINSS